MVRTVRFILSEGWFESIRPWLKLSKGQKIMQYHFFIHMSSINNFCPTVFVRFCICTILTEALLNNVDISMEAYLWGDCYTIYSTRLWRDTQRQDVWFLMKWGFTFTELKDILFHLTLLNCHTYECVNRLNHSWVFECAKRKKYRTKLFEWWFDTRTINKNVLFLFIPVFLILLLVCANTFQKLFFI